jgi:hypothetical protein
MNYVPGWPINTSTSSNGFAILNSDAYGGGSLQNADLVTPALDLSLFTSVNLYFQHYFMPWGSSTGTLSYSLNNGSTWTVIQAWTSTSNPEIFDQDMTALVAGHSGVRFKWNYIGNYDYFWAVDDIKITGTAPGLWTGNISSNWNDAGNWSGGLIPQTSTNVTIPAIAPNWPVYSGNMILGSNCSKLTMLGPSRLVINGNLTIPPAREFIINSNGNLTITNSPINR